MRQCPDHPRTVGASSTDCIQCRRESVPPTDEFRRALAAVSRRTVHHIHPEPPVTDVRAAREAIDSEGEPNE